MALLPNTNRQVLNVKKTLGVQTELKHIDFMSYNDLLNYAMKNAADDFAEKYSDVAFKTGCQEALNVAGLHKEDYMSVNKEVILEELHTELLKSANAKTSNGTQSTSLKKTTQNSNKSALANGGLTLGDTTTIDFGLNESQLVQKEITPLPEAPSITKPGWNKPLQEITHTTTLTRKEANNVATWMKDFTNGNMTVAELKTKLQGYMILCTETRSANYNVLSFSYKLNGVNKNFTIKCNKEASASANDFKRVITYTPAQLKSRQITDTKFINKYFDVVQAENGVVKKYALKAELGVIDLSQLLKLMKNDLVLNNFLNDKHKTSSDASVLEQLSDGNTLTESTMVKNYTEIDLAVGSDKDQLVSKVLDKLQKDYASGELSTEQLTKVLSALNLTKGTGEGKYTITGTYGNLSTLEFTLNGKKYTIKQNKDITGTGSDSLIRDDDTISLGDIIDGEAALAWSDGELSLLITQAKEKGTEVKTAVSKYIKEFITKKLKYNNFNKEYLDNFIQNVIIDNFYDSYRGFPGLTMDNIKNLFLDYYETVKNSTMNISNYMFVANIDPDNFLTTVAKDSYDSDTASAMKDIVQAVMKYCKSIPGANSKEIEDVINGLIQKAKDSNYTLSVYALINDATSAYEAIKKLDIKLDVSQLLKIYDAEEFLTNIATTGYASNTDNAMKDFVSNIKQYYKSVTGNDCNYTEDEIRQVIQTVINGAEYNELTISAFDIINNAVIKMQQLDDLSNNLDSIISDNTELNNAKVTEEGSKYVNDINTVYVMAEDYIKNQFMNGDEISLTTFRNKITAEFKDEFEYEFIDTMFVICFASFLSDAGLSEEEAKNKVGALCTNGKLNLQEDGPTIFEQYTKNNTTFRKAPARVKSNTIKWITDKIDYCTATDSWLGNVVNFGLSYLPYGSQGLSAVLIANSAVKFFNDTISGGEFMYDIASNLVSALGLPSKLAKAGIAKLKSYLTPKNIQKLCNMAEKVLKKLLGNKLYKEYGAKYIEILKKALTTITDTIPSYAKDIYKHAHTNEPQGGKGNDVPKPSTPRKPSIPRKPSTPSKPSSTQNKKSEDTYRERYVYSHAASKYLDTYVGEKGVISDCGTNPDGTTWQYWGEDYDKDGFVDKWHTVLYDENGNQKQLVEYVDTTGDGFSNKTTTITYENNEVVSTVTKYTFGDAFGKPNGNSSSVAMTMTITNTKDGNSTIEIAPVETYTGELDKVDSTVSEILTKWLNELDGIGMFTVITDPDTGNYLIKFIHIDDLLPETDNSQTYRGPNSNSNFGANSGITRLNMLRDAFEDYMQQEGHDRLNYNGSDPGVYSCVDLFTQWLHSQGIYD